MPRETTFPPMQQPKIILLKDIMMGQVTKLDEKCTLYLQALESF
jgi:hypothetical protein